MGAAGVPVIPQRRHSEPGEAAAELGGGSSPGCHQRRCKAVPKADLPKALPALLMSRQQGTVCSWQSGEQESEVCSIHGAVKEHLPIQERPEDVATHFPGAQEDTSHQQGDATSEHAVSEDVEDGACSNDESVREPLHSQEGPAVGVRDLPGAQEATSHQQEDATSERAVSEDVQDGPCSRDGSVREPLGPQDNSATNNEHKRNLRRFRGERFRSHPVGTAVLILLLLVLVLALGGALAVQSAAPQVTVTPATPQSVLGCPPGWLGYNGVCYYFSRDYGTWEQGQERCSQLGASLAIAKDEEAMDLLLRLRGSGDFWLGLRRRGERLQWEDGSSYSSQVPVPRNSQCVFLGDGNRLRSEFCSSERPYVCSKAQAPL